MKTKKFVLSILIILELLVASFGWSKASAISHSSETQGSILYVKTDAGTSITCTSWADACKLRTAILLATPGAQVWVAAGIYTLDTVNRYASFLLTNGAAYYGGFPSGGGTWESRDWVNNPTYISGDIGIAGDHSDDSYHVVYGEAVDSSTIVDGFIFMYGMANGTSPRNLGGGMYNLNSSPTLRNIIFSGNSASQAGGGMYNYNSSPSMTNVFFSTNTAGYDGGGIYNDSGSNPTMVNVQIGSSSAPHHGGGMYNNNSSPSLMHVIFYDNTASQAGGGMYNNYSNPSLTNIALRDNYSDLGGGVYNNWSNLSITNATFSGNGAQYGGGMYNINSNPTLTNATFNANSAAQRGGGLYNDSSSPTLVNITFSDNEAGIGGGMADNRSSSILKNATFVNNVSYLPQGSGIYVYQNSNFTMTNSIIWGDQITQLDIFSGPVTISYSDIQGGYTGIGNINVNPLLGKLWDYGGVTLTRALLPGSPAIDAGSWDPAFCPATDQRSYPRPSDGNNDGVARCDMGSYEFQLLLFYLPVVFK